MPWPSTYLEGLTDSQRAVMEPPYVGTHGLDGVNPLQRPELRSSDGQLTDEALESYGGEGWRTAGSAGQKAREAARLLQQKAKM